MINEEIKNELNRIYGKGNNSVDFIWKKVEPMSDSCKKYLLWHMQFNDPIDDKTKPFVDNGDGGVLTGYPLYVVNQLASYKEVFELSDTAKQFDKSVIYRIVRLTDFEWRYPNEIVNHINICADLFKNSDAETLKTLENLIRDMRDMFEYSRIIEAFYKSLRYPDIEAEYKTISVRKDIYDKLIETYDYSSHFSYVSPRQLALPTCKKVSTFNDNTQKIISYLMRIDGVYGAILTVEQCHTLLAIPSEEELQEIESGYIRDPFHVNAESDYSFDEQVVGYLFLKNEFPNEDELKLVIKWSCLGSIGRYFTDNGKAYCAGGPYYETVFIGEKNDN